MALAAVPRYTVDVRVDPRALRESLAADVQRGLTRRPRRLPPKYFYDVAGSALFEQITTLPEYYPTRAEHALLRAHGPALMARLDPDEIVEVGAGSAAKIRMLLDARRDPGRPLRYLPVDVDEATMAGAARELTGRYPRVEIHGLVGDVERDLRHLPPPRGRRLVLFLGSTIGNLDPPARRALLDDVRAQLGPGGRLLLGVDLVKDARVLEQAYDDGQGVTREFNRNVLRVINRVLGADFDPAAFRHVARYDPRAARVEMHLVAGSRQSVRVAGIGLDVDIEPGESIWTESSYKFTRPSVEAELASAGLSLEEWITGRPPLFALVLAAARDGAR